ncbi:hypothetical protein GCM10009030_16370 [Haloarcula pellucida]|uniref:Uncharacterized protein n=1 Tax=Haloarcula pellucida TaxID=1427151 RepID=A0A830GJ06_9EURY|nr:hypothetical protein GCM10009030_16370 [Halomicroarcula pellucida]
MTNDDADRTEPPDGAADSPPRPFRTEWRNVGERERARIRREAAGASRDLDAEQYQTTTTGSDRNRPETA